MIRERDYVILDVPLPEHKLRKGDVGTVVLCHGTKGFEVEFVTLGGETLAVVSLRADQVRPAAEGEIAHVRKVRAA